MSRDNTIKYNRRTLQLLPGGTRPTYAGVQVEVQRTWRAGFWCSIKDRPSLRRRAPPHSGMLRAIAIPHVEDPGGAGSQWDACLARLEPDEVDRDLRPRKSKAQQHSIPTARQKALWENVQQAKLRGLSLRAIARELGIHRNTARK